MNRETAVGHRLAPFTHASRRCYAASPRVASGRLSRAGTSSFKSCSE
jgi:hypothetical protein